MPRPSRYSRRLDQPDGATSGECLSLANINLTNTEAIPLFRDKLLTCDDVQLFLTISLPDESGRGLTMFIALNAHKHTSLKADTRLLYSALEV
jgi:hypothetical protein